jgi:hypothetical protein
VPTVDTDGVATRSDTSPVLYDMAAKMTGAIDREVERLVRLGLPVWVSRDGAVVDLNPELVLTRQAEAAKTA